MTFHVEFDYAFRKNSVGFFDLYSTEDTSEAEIGILESLHTGIYIHAAIGSCILMKSYGVICFLNLRIPNEILGT